MQGLLTEQRTEPIPEETGCGPAHPRPETGRQWGGRESEKGNFGPRDGILYLTVSRLLVANQVFLGSWMVDIHQDGRSQRSGPEKRHTGHRCLSCSDLG